MISLLAFSVQSAAPCQASNENCRRMVEDQIESRGLSDGRVLQAMREVPRQEFVPESVRQEAFEDHPLPIGCGQTISQPYIVAYMLEYSRLRQTDRVLEVGTGCGYQTALLAKLVYRVFTIEIIPTLANRARATLTRLGFGNIKYKTGDGALGWPEEAPFDAIIVTAAPTYIPKPLVDQLKEGGRLILPVGELKSQQLILLEKIHGVINRKILVPVRFVPLTRGYSNE
ncbi:MAG: protein-L-isoaspartate(D-aspartate) O-methyltransferase [Chthoniobacterales bacterium]